MDKLVEECGKNFKNVIEDIALVEGGLKAREDQVKGINKKKSGEE